MKKILLVLISFGIFASGLAQKSKSDRQVRKEARDKELLENFSAMGAAIDSRNFVLEIENIYLTSTERKKVNPMLNFILVDTTSCVWQSESSDIPTDLFKTVSKVEGSVDGWKLDKDVKHLRYFLQFKMFTDYGLYRVTVTFNPDKTISGNINGIRNNFNFYGYFIKHKSSLAH